MALDRKEAKSAIIKRNSSDPDLDDVMGNAHAFQLGLKKEEHRHAEEMRGLIAKIFGQGDSMPAYIAAVGMVIGVLTTIGCYSAAAYYRSQYFEFWSKAAERSIAFSSTCLAFIFGKGVSKS